MSFRRPWLVLVALAVASAAAGCGGSSHSSSSAPPDNATEQLVAKAKTGVIRIETTTCEGKAVGTGFLISPRLVATVEHVIDGASVIVLKRNGKVLSSAKVIGDDPTRDLALLQTKEPISGYRLRLATRAPRLAEQVAALGFPFGLPLTVTQGSVSGLGRSIPIANVKRRQLVQTDAALNPGNSGGPLLATDTGQVVGLVDLGSEANGTSFAVSSKVAAPLLQAWRVAPQPVPLDTCGGFLAGGGGGSSPPSSTASSTAYRYAEAVSRILANSASVRKQLVDAAAEAHSNPAAARSAVAAVVAARRDELSLAQSMSVPSGASQVQTLLVNAFSLSLASDRLYQRWIASGSASALKQAQANDTQAVAVKTSFLRQYNQLRRQVGLAPIRADYPF